MKHIPYRNLSEEAQKSRINAIASIVLGERSPIDLQNRVLKIIVAGQVFRRSHCAILAASFHDGMRITDGYDDISETPFLRKMRDAVTCLPHERRSNNLL
jgi:hypothetical protein